MFFGRFFNVRQVAALVCLHVVLGAGAANWPQFRGIHGRAVAHERTPMPDRIDLSEHTIWKVPMASGQSSPVIFDNQIYLTALREEKLLTIALDRETGAIVWEREAPYEKLEEHHRRSSPAVASVATDGRRVVSFFGSFGLLCYDTDGRELWRKPLGPFNDPQGAASSPVIADGKVFLERDQDTDSFLAAYDLNSGRKKWRVDRPNVRRNYGTPTLWKNGDKFEIVSAATATITGYSLRTGRQNWQIHGCARVVSATPVVGYDGSLYVVNAGGGGDLRAKHYPPFKQVIADADANGNGLLEKKEIPGGPIAGFIDQFDRDASGALDEEEYESIRRIYRSVRHVAMAVRPGGSGDITDTHVKWTQDRMIPRNASPVVHNGHLFMVRDGGILTSLDIADGAIVKSERLEKATGSYFSSPVIGDKKVFLFNDRGMLSIVTAEGDWKQIGSTDFDEDVLATPAIVNGRIYVRTAEHLYCLGLRKEERSARDWR
jgi:outer membrane protein assembly factor BamB